MNFSLDQATATLIVGVIMALVQVWNTFILGKVHTLTNSNFSEAKAARLAAEAALTVSNNLNLNLQQQLNTAHETSNALHIVHD